MASRLTGPRLVAAKALLTVLVKPHSVVTTVLEVAGLALVSTGCFRVGTTIGLIVTGSVLLLVGVVAEWA